MRSVHCALRLRAVRRRIIPIIWVAIWAGAVCVWAQEKPKLQLNVMNVCTPNEAEQAQLAAALAKLSERPVFGPDFEVARGRTTGPEGAVDWVRLRREFSRNPTLSNVQFIFSNGLQPATASGRRQVSEKLVFHANASRPGEPLQISLEHESEGETAAQVLGSETSPNRIRLERFGSPSLVLARCSQADQSAYEPLFRTAAARFATYRTALRVRSVVAAELTSLSKTTAAAQH
jgi:hypothetical protein